MGKLGAFLNKDIGSLVKDAGKLLNTDVGRFAKDAKRVVKSDLGDLLPDAPKSENPANEARTASDVAVMPVSIPATPVAPTAVSGFDPDVTQKMAGAPAAATPFDPDITQKLDRTNTLPSSASVTGTNAEESTAAQAAEIATFNLALLMRAARDMPSGNEVRILLPYTVGDFERPHAAPAGQLTNDPVHAVYAGRGESVLVQLALCWDADEALQRVHELLTKTGQAARTTSDRTWVIGPSPQGIVYAWTRDCYYFCVNSPKGTFTMSRFLSAYPY